jgi:hypothetical protein
MLLAPVHTQCPAAVSGLPQADCRLADIFCHFRSFADQTMCGSGATCVLESSSRADRRRRVCSTFLRGGDGPFLTFWDGRDAERHRSTTKSCKRLSFWWRNCQGC